MTQETDLKNMRCPGCGRGCSLANPMCDLGEDYAKDALEGRLNLEDATLEGAIEQGNSTLNDPHRHRHGHDHSHNHDHDQEHHHKHHHKHGHHAHHVDIDGSHRHRPHGHPGHHAHHGHGLGHNAPEGIVPNDLDQNEAS